MERVSFEIKKSIDFTITRKADRQNYSHIKKGSVNNFVYQPKS